jgi:hypothetical protein
VLWAAIALLLAATPAAAEIASALLREDDALPGAPGETVSSLNNPVVNHVGGFGVTVNTTGSGTTLSHIWGNATGGPGDVIITEGTFGDLAQTSFESFHGLSNAGMPAYSAIATDTGTGTTGLDGVWVGMTPVLVEEDPVPTLPGEYSTFNSRPGITGDGQPYWVGGFAPKPGQSTQNRAIFYGFGITPIIMGGDGVAGVPEPIETGSSNIDFDYRFSAAGTNYIGQVVVDTGSNADDGVVVSNGAAVMRAGMVVREGSPVPAAIGGLADENWDNFDYFGITEAGLMLFTGDTNAPSAMDEFVVLGPEIVLREGDTLVTPTESFTLAGSIEGAYLNEQGDWAVTWDITDAAGDNVEGLLFNGELVVKEGDPVDLDGDGVVEPDSLLANFTGLSALVVGDRQPDGTVSIYFTADIDTMGTSSSGDDTEALFCVEIQLIDDADGDGVLDAEDVCPETSIPEEVPQQELGVNRWALVDEDDVFDTTPPPGGGNGPGFEFTLEDTHGCSCEQIIEEMELGLGHTKFGCSSGAMLHWVTMVSGYEMAGPLVESAADHGGLQALEGDTDDAPASRAQGASDPGTRRRPALRPASRKARR